ncbi:MAG TPA: metalloregulator ArsR/SmtB family transcription factor [Bryobacteraceae bacterium]|nr:metalloregulator ArsR/SmtB family transcription factor [Bryobacteraceae bacterium]
MDQTLAALAEPTRRRVIDLLRRRPHRAGELARAARVSAPLMSRHLRVLRVSGLVEETHEDPRDSRIRMYRLRRGPFSGLRGWLDEIEMFWTDQLGAFREHVENSKGGGHT